MLEQIKMPALGATMEEGVIIAWKVKEGDEVAKGDIILELESDKSTFDFESPCAGVVRKIFAGDGDTVPVQQMIAIIGDVNEQIPDGWLQEKDCEGQIQPSQQSESAEQKGSVTQGKSRGVKISPRARKLADKLGVDIAKVRGSGPGGRIESSDIEKHS